MTRVIPRRSLSAAICVARIFILSLCFMTMMSPSLSSTFLITKKQQDCELESLNMGTRLADRYNSLDEATDWDIRIHHDYLTKYMGFSTWIQTGTWKNTHLTTHKNDAPHLYKVKLSCDRTIPYYIVTFIS